MSIAVNLCSEVEHAFSTQVMPIYDHLQRNSPGCVNWRTMSEDALWSELSLCILSSGVPYEMATSAHRHLRMRGLLDLRLHLTVAYEKTIARELASPICLPRRKNGCLRSYRFPNIRAKCLLNSVRYLYHEPGGGLHSLLDCPRSERELRELLVENLSGLGFKEASHFLRNVGFSSYLAIIDTHILSFMRKAGLVPESTIRVNGRNEYVELEDILIEMADRNGLDLSILDMALWLHMKGG